jgi:hypothetical protein
MLFFRFLRQLPALLLGGVVVLLLGGTLAASPSPSPSPSTPVNASEENTAQPTENHGVKICPLTKRENPWGAFLPGTWVARRTNSQRFQQGSVSDSNTTDTYLILEDVGDTGIVLRQESIVGIGGRLYTPEAKQISFDHYQQAVAENVEIEQLQPQTVVVERRQVICQVCRYTQLLSDEKKTTTIWYSHTVMPFLLRLEEVRTKIPTEETKEETVVQHTIMNVTETSGVRLFKNLLRDYKTQTIKKNLAGTTVSHASYSANIPGGLLQEISTEMDSRGKIVGRSVTSVTDYCVASLGTPVRQPRSNAKVSQEMQSAWDSLIEETTGNLPDEPPNQF